MQTTASSVQEYLEQLPDERKTAMIRLREVILENLPEGYTESMGSVGPGYCIPHSLYPSGYHVNPKLPLQLITIASQKNFIALYHMGLYMNPALLNWFTTEYAKHSRARLDMGKACVRFNKPDQIPFDLIGELARKITPQDFIRVYEQVLAREK